MTAMQVVKCKRCGDPFHARTADIKRGWGKFCSKSCKAIKQSYGGSVFKPGDKPAWVQQLDWEEEYARAAWPLGSSADFDYKP